MHRGLCLAIAAAILLSSTAASATDNLVAMMVDVHELPGSVVLDEGTVAAALSDGALFASSEHAYVVQQGKSKPKISTVPAHPTQSHHKSSMSISIGSRGALVMLVDDRRRLSIVRYDAKEQSWATVARPIGFVPRGHVVLGDLVVFPQGARSPAWFAYDAAQGTFRRFARPEGVRACAGAAFEANGRALVAGKDENQAACAISFDPSKAAWATLAPPPAPFCSAVVVSRGLKHYVLGPACGKVEADSAVYDSKNHKWSKLPKPPVRFTAAHSLFATAGGVGAWRLHRGKLNVWSLTPRGDSWKSTEESLPLELRKVANVGPGQWLLAAKQRGTSVLVHLRYEPTSSQAERNANRDKIDASDSTTSKERDWKAATQKEREAAIRRGLGAVERYVPPQLDPKSGKVVTKGAWVFALGEELVVWPVTPKRCVAFIDRIISKWPTEPTGAKWKVSRGNGFARSGKRLLYGPAAACRSATSCKTDYFSERVAPLSQVGPVFSIAVHTSEAHNCGSPLATERWKAVDLRTGKAAPMTAVISESSILEALKKHKTTRKLVAGASSLDEAIAAMRIVDPAGFDGYAFGGWRSMTRRVEMRIEFHPKAADLVEPVNVWVEPTAEFLEAFEAAAQQPGMFMSASK